MQGHDEAAVYTIEEAARLLGIGRSSAYAAARRGEIPTVRLGRRLVVPKVAFERLLQPVKH
ncbi:MAG: helix-turn-helix domain-containing protein [Proteobacteria bacterium]|nr:helix-turn-helix domain-containing protein [Pseudomonadota bacterium]